MLFLSLFGCKALGTKRLATDELVHEWDNKRLNLGQVRIHFSCMVFRFAFYCSNLVNTYKLGISFSLNEQANPQLQSYPGFEQMVGTGGDPNARFYAPYPISSGTAPNLQVSMQFPQQATGPALLGKG